MHTFIRCLSHSCLFMTTKQQKERKKFNLLNESFVASIQQYIHIIRISHLFSPMLYYSLNNNKRVSNFLAALRTREFQTRGTVDFFKVNKRVKKNKNNLM